MKKIKIDSNKCIGCGTCIALCGEENINFDENGKASVVNKEAFAEDDVIASCPVEAIEEDK